MLNPLSVELLANETVRRRLLQATQDALADQLPHSPTIRPSAVARQFLASGLRALATRLDPGPVSETGLVVANSR